MVGVSTTAAAAATATPTAPQASRRRYVLFIVGSFSADMSASISADPAFRRSTTGPLRRRISGGDEATIRLLPWNAEVAHHADRRSAATTEGSAGMVVAWPA